MDGDGNRRAVVKNGFSGINHGLPSIQVRPLVVKLATESPAAGVRVVAQLKLFPIDRHPAQE
ncbi:hypothetical protein AHiyo1_47840 [Arthrobacter sp. Hiyo1]|nr:hypothetical protein AHiyo1_47840 [Arthrobacter sp. Hiyo1]